MLKSGNGAPKRCIENLVSIVRGEIPFDRVRGIDARIIDSPSEDAAIELEQDARWNIETYEPRARANSTEIIVTEAEKGGFAININITESDDITAI